MPFKSQIKVIEFLLGCIFWMLHVIKNSIMFDLTFKGYPMSNFERLNKQFWAMFEPTLTWPDLSFGQLLTELKHIMTTYDFLWDKQAILSNICTDFNLIIFTFHIRIG